MFNFLYNTSVHGFQWSLWKACPWFIFQSRQRHVIVAIQTDTKQKQNILSFPESTLICWEQYKLSSNVNSPSVLTSAAASDSASEAISCCSSMSPIFTFSNGDLHVLQQLEIVADVWSHVCILSDLWSRSNRIWNVVVNLKIFWLWSRW